MHLCWVTVSSRCQVRCNSLPCLLWEGHFLFKTGDEASGSIIQINSVEHRNTFTVGYAYSWCHSSFPGNSGKQRAHQSRGSGGNLSLSAWKTFLSQVPGGNCPMLSAWMHAVSSGWQSNGECDHLFCQQMSTPFCNKTPQKASLRPGFFRFFFLRRNYLKKCVESWWLEP